MERALGNRGSKAKRQRLGKIRPEMAPQGFPLGVPEPPVEKSQEQIDHEVRNRARATGLIVPPSPAEQRAAGTKASASSANRFTPPTGLVPPSGLVMPK